MDEGLVMLSLIAIHLGFLRAVWGLAVRGFQVCAGATSNRTGKGQGVLPAELGA